MAPLAATADAPPDNSIAWHLWVGVLTTAIPATAAVILRFYARIKGRIALKADDWLIVGALLSVWAMAGLRFSQVIHYDLGRHTYYVPDWKVEDFKKSFLATQVMYFSSATFTRSSILFFYRRIFVSKTFNILVWIVLSMVMGYFISCSIAAVFGCQPISWFWNQDQPGQCMDEILFFRVNGIMNLILDLIVLLLPIPMLWRLQMYTKKKIALSLIFSLGFFACLCSCFRLLQFDNPKWKNQTDPMWAFVHAGVWSSIEQSVGVICACLPCLRLLLRPSFGWDRETDRRTATQPHYTSRSRYTGNERSQQQQSVNHESSSELGLTMANSIPDSLGISTSNTIHSESTEKAEADSYEKGGIWRTQEVHQDSAPAHERYG